MDKAMTDRIEQQVRQAFPESAIARVQVLQYGDDPEVEPGQAAVRVFFNWPGQAEGGQASPKTVHQFCNASAVALGVLRDGLPDVIGWAEFRPEGEARRPRWWPVLPDRQPRTTRPCKRGSAGGPHSRHGPARGR